MQRRRLTAALLLAGLTGGCGFSPLYARQDADSSVAAQLRQVEVGLIPDRPGQLLRLELQRQLEGAGASGGKAYLLTVNLSIQRQGTATEFATSATTRLRLTGNARWSLTDVAGEAHQVTSGWAKTTDGYNAVDVQYFYDDLRDEQVIRQITADLAQKISQQLAVYFKNNTGRSGS